VVGVSLKHKLKELECLHGRMIDLLAKGLNTNLRLLLLFLLLVSFIPSIYGQTVETNSPLADDESEPVEAPVTDLECDRAKRKIELGAWGMIHVHDEFHVSNPTPTPIDSVTLSLPLNSQNATASDIAGPIDVFIPSRSEDLAPRAIVYFRLNLGENESYTFSIHFKIPASKNIELLNFDLYQFEFPMIPGLGSSIKTLLIEVVLPEGAALNEEDISPSPLEVGEEIFRKKAIFLIDDARFENNRKLALPYRYLITWSAFRPTLWVGLALASIISARRILRVAKFESQLIPIPMDLIRSFVDAMDERISLKAELASLGDRLESRAISKRVYRRRSRTIERQLASLSKELNELKEELKNSGEKYLEVIKRTEVAEVDLETSEENLDRLEKRYRRGRISRGVYDRLRHEYRDRIKAAGTEINRVVIELREEIR
jgi:hypothetical protein